MYRGTVYTVSIVRADTFWPLNCALLDVQAGTLFGEGYLLAFSIESRQKSYRFLFIIYRKQYSPKYKIKRPSDAPLEQPPSNELQRLQ